MILIISLVLSTRTAFDDDEVSVVRSKCMLETMFSSLDSQCDYEGISKGGTINRRSISKNINIPHIRHNQTHTNTVTTTLSNWDKLWRFIEDIQFTSLVTLLFV